MKDPLLARIVEHWPVAVNIGWMKQSDLMFSEEYVLVEIRAGIRFVRKPSNYHPVYVLEDDEGVTWYYHGLMPG